MACSKLMQSRRTASTHCLNRLCGWEGLAWQADPREHVCPQRAKASASSRSLGAPDSSDTCSPHTPLQPQRSTSAPSASTRELCPSRRKPSCTPKPIKVSSGNRFYAEVVRQRLKECNGSKELGPTLARDLPKRDVKEPRMQEATRSKRTLEIGEALGVPSGFSRVPS
jgi:hypothetical protein